MIKKILFIAFVIFVFTPTAKSQISYYKSIEKSNDTSADLRYIKNLDRTIKQKLDSFIVFLRSKKEFKKITGFIQFNIFKSSQGRTLADLSFNYQYCEYRIFALKKSNFGDVFAYSFYKSNLVLFTLPYSIHRIKEGDSSVLNDLMYAELSPEVQEEIDRNAEEFNIEFIGLVKRYYLN